MVAGTKPFYALTFLHAQNRGAQARNGGMIIETDVTPTTLIANAFRVTVVAKRGPDAEMIIAMRNVCDPQGVRALGRVNAAKEKERKKRIQAAKEILRARNLAAKDRARREKLAAKKAATPAKRVIQEDNNNNNESQAEEGEEEVQQDAEEGPLMNSDELGDIEEDAQMLLGGAGEADEPEPEPEPVEDHQSDKRQRVDEGDADAVNMSAEAAVAVAVGDGDNDEDLLAILREGAREAETLTRSLRDPRNWLKHLLELADLERKYTAREFDLLKTNKKIREQRFGKGAAIPISWPPDYDSLLPRKGHWIYETLLRPYYDSCEDRRVRRGIPLPDEAALATDAEMIAAFGEAWTMASALLLPTAAKEKTTFAFSDPREYYPRVYAAHEEFGDDVAPIDVMYRRTPDLFESGAPAPQAYPQGGRYVVRVNAAYLYPEIMRTQPFPYAMGAMIDERQYKETLEATVNDCPGIFVDMQRMSNGQMGFAQQREAAKKVLSVVNTSNGRTNDNIEKEVDAFMTAQGADLPVAGGDTDIPALLSWAQMRHAHVAKLLSTATNEVKEGRYPGLLSKSRIAASEAYLAVLYERVQSVAAARAAAGEDGGGGGEEAEGVDGGLFDAATEYIDAVEREFAENADMAAARITQDAKNLSDSLMSEFHREKAHAGKIGQLSEKLFERSDQLKLNAINTAHYKLFETSMVVAKYDEKTRQPLFLELQESRCAITWDCLKRSRCESDPLLRMRADLWQKLRAAGEGHYMPMQEPVNGCPMQTMLVWLETMIGQPFKVANKNMQTALVLYFAAKTALMLPDMSSGEPLMNVSMEGDNSSGKSFLLNLMILIHLSGSCVNANHISPHAFTTGENNSNAIILEHEAPHDQFLDPHDSSSREKKTSDVGADPKKANLMKRSIPSLRSSINRPVSLTA